MPRITSAVRAALGALCALLCLALAVPDNGRTQTAVPLEDESYIINIPDGFAPLDPDVVAEHHELMLERLKMAMPDWQPLFNQTQPPEHGFSPIEVKQAPLASPHLLVDEYVGPMNMETDTSVLMAAIQSTLEQNLRALSASEPVPMYHTTAPGPHTFYVEYMVDDPENFAPEYHAFRVVMSQKGLVVAYWYAYGDDYRRYVRELRPAALSLKFLPR